MSVIHAPRQATLDERQLFIPVLLAVAIVFFIGRLWFVQVVRADSLAALGASTTIDTVKSLAPRGRIVDRNGELLAGVRQNAVVTAVYDTVKDHPGATAEVARLLGVEPGRLEKPLSEAAFDPFVPNVIYVGVPPQAASYIAEAGDRLPGYGLVFQPTRMYTESHALTHVLGYVWRPTEKEVNQLEAQGIEPQAYVGRDGLEKQYERRLMGVPGAEHIAVDPRMRPIRTISVDKAVPGEELVLALDARLQRLALELLGENRGAVVASDPRTGEILCMVSSPSYSIRLYDHGISAADYKSLKDNPATPLLNRTVLGLYEPGSTFKITTAIAAQLGGVFDPSRQVTCNQLYRFGNRQWRCLGKHGSVDFRRAMAASCNVYFYDLAMRAGAENLRRAILAMGLGDRQGIDLPSEYSGAASNAKWLGEEKWLPYEPLLVGIGQGPVFTPLQMLSVVSLAANGGTVYKPRLLLGAKNVNGELQRTSSSVLTELDLPASFWNAMREALVSVISEGTAASSARIEGVRWGGKTGSAQNQQGEMAHGWFVGFAPADDPQIAISVIVENAGHGGVVAAPIARQIVSRYLRGDLPIAPEVQSSVRRVASRSTSSASSSLPSNR